jgi:3',5'-cyclic AMP phosphodiesterase CpdA
VASNLIISLACLWCSAASATVDFVQITDPHIFDGDAKGDMKDNRNALKWCVEKINQLQGEGKDFKFVVMTGDFGLEGVADYLNPEGQHSEIVRTAHELAGFLKPSKVRKWLFLPGNNDLVEENPRTIGIYREFVRTLKTELPDIDIADFSVTDFDLTEGEATYRFIGFDNASFKANDASIDAECFDSIRQIEVQRVADRVRDTKGYAYVFYHIPEIDDPYYASLKPGDPTLKARANSRDQYGKDFPLSAWSVTPAVRTKWNAIVGDDKVKGLFAGHFHSSEREDYTDMTRLNSAHYPAIELHKLFVCPPLASKKQEKKKEQARGLRSMTLGADGRVASAEIVWLEQPSPSPTPSEKKCAKDQGRDSRSDKRGPHQLIGDIESLFKILAIMVGGWWTWAAYVRKRIRFPMARLEHMIKHWSDEGTTFLHVTLRVSNIGNVLMPTKDVCCRVERLTPPPEAVRDHIRAKTDPVGSSGTEIEWVLLGERKVDPDAGYEIEPGEQEEFSFDFTIEGNVTRVLIYSFVENPLKAARRRGKSIGWSITTIYDLS